VALVRLIFGLLRLAFALATLAVIAVIAVAGYLLLAGSGDAPSCASRPPENFDRAARVIAFDAKLSDFLRAGGAGPAAIAGFGEDETEARAQVFFDGRTDRISDIAVCFEDGSARAFARLDTVLGRQVGVNAGGYMDLSGEHPRVRISGARVAGISLPGPGRRAVEDQLNRELEDIDLDFPMSLTMSQDAVTLGRQR
jgi:hypothetical protein